jgi:hypothetical protein
MMSLCSSKWSPIWLHPIWSCSIKPLSVYSGLRFHGRAVKTLNYHRLQKKIFWFSMLLKKYSDFGWGKKKPDSEFLSYNLKLNSGKIFCAFLIIDYRLK